jgi:hypothetical protein
MKMMIYSALSTAPSLTSWLLWTYYGFQLLFVVWYVAKMLWLRFYDVVAWHAMIFGVCEIWVKQKVLQYLDYRDHIIFLVVMSMCSWHIRCTNASRVMWCIKDYQTWYMVNTIVIVRNSQMCLMFHWDLSFK